ncbi:restriction endonuclease subunit S [Lentibacillus salicampi]|uniref:Restriction endonuclease subunit S n=1 Tax=Lentibacillus salicampi TaxID=175306 RepID=A0A4Y9A9Y7_9BACI|nr:restriction endonuclease subunit S [Lentibacillus salicampi]TFJ90666.1 restriction endonuclease subunit S [Lentibacillus salicampi]
MDRCTGTSFPAIAPTDLSMINISLPSNYSEQQKIGEFFKVLDERIANQERKIAKVKALKSAYLTEMFPQEGETVPKRRFKGFEGEWVVKELSDLVYKAVDNRGKTPPLNKKGIHPIIEVISLGDRKPNYSNVEKYIDKFTYNDFLRDYVKENDILFSTVGRIGVVSMMDSNQYATIAQNIVGFRANENYCPNFLYALFSNKLNFKRVNKIVMGAVQPSVKVSELIKVNYLISSNFEEQQKIGAFFKNLDNQIEMEEKKLDKLQKMKEAYLEEMFV